MSFTLASKMRSAALVFVAVAGGSAASSAFAMKLGGGPITVGPYAAVSSTKTIKPKATKDATTSEEVVTQRQTYGIKVDVRLLSFFSLGVNVGQNQVDTTKKQVAMRDEYEEIDFQKDANLSLSQDSEYRYKETQRMGTAQLVFAPRLFSLLTVKAGGGVRARQRLIEITDKVSDKSSKIQDPIRYHAMATAGLSARLFPGVSASADYKFYFLKFPKTEPHEQEVSISFGLQL